MPTSRSLLDARFVKLLVLVNGLVPAALLVWDAVAHQLGVNEVNFAIRTTGLVGLICLVLALLVTPVRRLTGWGTLISARRYLGVLGFGYIAAHFLIFVRWDRDGSLRSTLEEIIERVYLWFGFGALLLMIPLAITSTDGMVTRLGARRWKLLHRLAYPAAIGGVVHYLLLVKADLRQPLAFGAIVATLLGYRVVRHYLDLRREVTTAHARLASARAAAPTKPRTFWSGELRVARIFDETPDVKTFRLVSPTGGPLPFAHVAGQYLNLALAIDGKRVNRSYTIASSPTRSAYCEISVKRAADGSASAHLHATLREGSLLEVSAPAGRFVFTGTESARVILVAGGVGITPMMSIVRSLTDRCWAGDMYLVFSVRKRHDIIFEAELTHLAQRFPNLHVCVTLTNDPDQAWDGERGQISAAMLQRVIPDLERGPVLVCGPTRMMAAMRELFVSLGVPDAEVSQEAFGSPPAPESAAGAAPSPRVDLVEGDVPNVRFQRAGKTAELPGLTVLEAAEEAGVSIPFECRSGICGQCKTTLVTGQVTMEVEDALTPADRSRRVILACQARAQGDVVVDA